MQVISPTNSGGKFTPHPPNLVENPRLTHQTWWKIQRLTHQTSWKIHASPTKHRGNSSASSTKLGG
ncbi:hypothetical protein, partial [Ligilactobacillus sp.]|uniref:hypothetical protein n=1 Tax=Ligilactobacillus sp. TaxID=2767921 RepID=UPI002FE109C5